MFDKEILWWFIKRSATLDLVFLSFKNDNVIKMYPFKRIPVFCYLDQLNEYQQIYCVHLEFIRLTEELNKRIRNRYISKRAA